MLLQVFCKPIIKIFEPDINGAPAPSHPGPHLNTHLVMDFYKK